MLRALKVVGAKLGVEGEQGNLHSYILTLNFYFRRQLFGHSSVNIKKSVFEGHAGDFDFIKHLTLSLRSPYLACFSLSYSRTLENLAV